MRTVLNNRYFQATSICFILIIILLVCFQMGIVSSNTSVAIGVAIIGLIGVSFQIIINRDISSAGYDLELQKTFTNDLNMTNLFLYCWNKYDNREFKINDKIIYKLEDIPNINQIVVSYFTFFESIYLMYKRNVIRIEFLDDLFGRRFFSVVNNKEIQDLELIKNWKYYRNIFYLFIDWSNYKISHKQEYALMYDNCLLIEIKKYNNKHNNDLLNFISEINKKSKLINGHYKGV